MSTDALAAAGIPPGRWGSERLRSLTGGERAFYPFSGHPTPHRVRFDGREVYAMCAIDALGVAPMLHRPIEVVSSDPIHAQPNSALPQR